MMSSRSDAFSTAAAVTRNRLSPAIVKPETGRCSIHLVMLTKY